MASNDMMFLVEEYHHLQIGWDDILLATENFSLLIGKGGFGPVYKGRLSLPEGESKVAIKCLDSKSDQGNTEFWREIMMLSRYKHKNLVSLLHFCFHDDKRILVYEFASRGSLDSHLSSTSLKWLQRLKICLGVANGLNYLHDPKGGTQRVLHRDIKSANILLDEEWNAKISDFGLSKFGPANQSKTFQVTNDKVGTFGYGDPSYFQSGLLSKETDVYSFGVVLFEVMCGKLCRKYCDGRPHILVEMWKKCFEDKTLDDIICPHLKAEMDEDSFKTFSTIAHRCLHINPRRRPTMVDIVQRLEYAIKQHEFSQSRKDNLFSFKTFVTQEFMRWVVAERKRISFRGRAMSVWKCNPTTSKCR